jgi:hypothetical protein
MFARFKIHAAVAIVLMTIFWTLITINQFLAIFRLFDYISDDLTSSEAVVFLLSERTMVATAFSTAFIMIPVISVILLSVAPAKAVSRRLIFLALGLLLLIALNELSKLGLDVTAPKLQG